MANNYWEALKGGTNVDDDLSWRFDHLVIGGLMRVDISLLVKKELSNTRYPP